MKIFLKIAFPCLVVVLLFSLVSCGPRTSQDYREEAKDLMTEEDYPGAIRYYRKAMIMEKDSVEKGKISCEIGMALYQLDQFARAADAIERGLELCPDYPTARGVLGLSYYNIDPVTYRQQVILNLQAYIDEEPNSKIVPGLQGILDELRSPVELKAEQN